MKRILLAGALLIALAAVSSRALALGPGFAFGVHANFTSSSFPGPSTSGLNQQINSAYGVGWGGGVHVDANLMLFSVRLTGDYIHYAIDETKFRDSFRSLFGSAADQMSVSGGGLGIVTIAVNGKNAVHHRRYRAGVGEQGRGDDVDHRVSRKQVPLVVAERQDVDRCRRRRGSEARDQSLPRGEVRVDIHRRCDIDVRACDGRCDILTPRACILCSACLRGAGPAVTGQRAHLPFAQ